MNALSAPKPLLRDSLVRNPLDSDSPQPADRNQQRRGQENNELADKEFTDDELVQLAKAAADPLRLQILRALRTESFGVSELCSIFDLAQPKLSHHLKVMLSAGVVATRREGNSIFYRRTLADNDNPTGRYLQSLFDALDHLPLAPLQLKHIEQIKRDRANRSLQFFAKHAEKFSEKQALITNNAQYAANMNELLDAAKLEHTATAIEIGPGEGDYLVELAQRFDKVVAIDNAATMLELAQQTATERDLDNIAFIQGELSDNDRQIKEFRLQGRRLTGQLAICNMVLHHIASPASAFRQIAALLQDDGYLLLAELGRHDQDWVRESCGDLWLGFEVEDLIHWAGAANFQPRQSQYLSLRNGFDVQLHLFQKTRQ